MRNAFLILASFALAVTGCNKGGGTMGSNRAPNTEDEKTLYALGLNVGRNLQVFSLTPDELGFVQQGLSDAITNAEPKVKLEEYGPKIGELARNRNEKRVGEEKKKSEDFLTTAAKESGA